MPTDAQIALAKTRSLKSTIFNAMAELGMRAEEALDAGDEALSSQLSLKLVSLGQQAALVRRTEIQLLSETSLAGPTAKLESIASDARTTLKSLKETADTLAHAAQLITIVGRLSSTFT
ncbi:MAG: hypothetical protein AAF683_02850 [Pseudomonadota bacterium]